MAFKAIYFLVVLICGASGEFVLVFVVVVENEFYIFIKVFLILWGYFMDRSIQWLLLADFRV